MNLNLNINFYFSKVKLGHWDSEIRIVAAKSLGQLTKLDPNLAILNLQEIIVHTMSSIPNLRHGSLFAIAEIIKSYAFYHPNLELPEDITSEITQLVLKLDKSRLFRYFSFFFFILYFILYFILFLLYLS